jgi:hypothetical protein
MTRFSYRFSVAVALLAPLSARAAPQGIDQAFNACVIKQQMEVNPASPAGTLAALKRISFMNHGPGTTDQELQIGFVTDPSVTAVQLYSHGSYGSGVKFYALQVPEAYFQWIQSLIAKYNPLYIDYKYELDDTGEDTFTGVTLGPVPPGQPQKCP